MTNKKISKDNHRPGYYKEYRELKKAMANSKAQLFCGIMAFVVKELGNASTAGIENNLLNDERIINEIVENHEKDIVANEDYIMNEMNDVATAPLFQMNQSSDLQKMSKKERAAEVDRLKARLLVLEKLEQNEEIMTKKKALTYIDKAIDVINAKAFDVSQKKRANRLVASSSEEHDTKGAKVVKIADTTGSFLGGLISSLTGAGGEDKN